MNSYKVSVHPYCCCFSRIISSKRPPPFPFPLPHTLLLTLPSSTQAVVLVVLGYLLYTIRRCVFSCAATLLLCHRPPSLGSESETEAWLASQLSQPTKSPRFLWTLTFTEYMVRENLFFFILRSDEPYGQTDRIRDGEGRTELSEGNSKHGNGIGHISLSKSRTYVYPHLRTKPRAEALWP